MKVKNILPYLPLVTIVFFIVSGLIVKITIMMFGPCDEALSCGFASFLASSLLCSVISALGWYLCVKNTKKTLLRIYEWICLASCCVLAIMIFFMVWGFVEKVVWPKFFGHTPSYFGLAVN